MMHLKSIKAESITQESLTCMNVMSARDTRLEASFVANGGAIDPLLEQFATPSQPLSIDLKTAIQIRVMWRRISMSRRRISMSNRRKNKPIGFLLLIQICRQSLMSTPAMMEIYMYTKGSMKVIRVFLWT